LDAINNEEELEAAQIDTAAQAKFTHVDKDKIGEDIDSIVPSKSEADLAAEKAARDKMELDAINNEEELEAAQIDTAAQAKFTHVDKDKIGEDIDSVVPSKGATDAEMKAAEAQDNIDKAIERQKEAQQKLNDLLMGASEEDIGEQYEYYARQLDEANQNLAEVVDESMGDLARGIKNSGDDFADSTEDVMDDIKSLIPGPTDEEMQAIADQDAQNKELENQQAEQANLDKINEANGGDILANMDTGPKYSEQAAAEPADTLDRSKISFGSVTKIGPNGMPILAPPKKDEKALPKVENPDDARENAKFNRQAEESKKAAEAKTKAEADKKDKSGEKSETKSLDDVVKTLEKLNTAMEKLIAVNNSNGSLLRDQIKATKGVASAASGNVIGAH